MRKLKPVMAGLVLLLGVAQFVQPDRANPPHNPSASFEAVAKAPQPVPVILDRSCRDCHSNRTAWPWYSRISPVSWLVASDVKRGRAHLNLSEWNRYGPEMSNLRLVEICEEMKKGDMPLWYYVPMHPDAKLSQAEVKAVCAAAGRS